MKSIIFSYNLKRAVKKSGYKVSEMSEKLNISQPTYINKVKNCLFTINELFEIELILNTSFAILCTPLNGVNYSSVKDHVKKKKNTVKKVITKDVQHCYKKSYLDTLL